MERCNAFLGRERVGGTDAEWTDVACLLPREHDGPHADWSAWLGVPDPNFSAPGASKRDAPTAVT